MAAPLRPAADASAMDPDSGAKVRSRSRSAASHYDCRERAPMPNDRIDIRLIEGSVSWEPPPLIEEGGGECAFLGRSRAEVHERHGRLILLRYTAYESMACRVLEGLARRAIDEYGALFVRILHALGDVPVGEASVLVQTVCPHRAEAFDACRMLIDRLKAQAPIWKSEAWADGTTWSRGQAINPDIFADHDDDDTKGMEDVQP